MGIATSTIRSARAKRRVARMARHPMARRSTFPRFEASSARHRKLELAGADAEALRVERAATRWLFSLVGGALIAILGTPFLTRGVTVLLPAAANSPASDAPPP